MDHRTRDLVWHFFDRFFDAESLSPQGRPEAGVIQTLGILAAPSGFVALLVMILHVQGWDLVGLRFLFVCYSMIAIGIVMVFEWDALFPDKRDYLVLTPLPLPVFTLFVAKLAALAMFLAMFLAAINSFGLLFWTGIETRGGFFPVVGAHFLIMFSAGLFSALSLGALQGILVTVFRGPAYRRVSVSAQTATMALLVMLLFLSPMLSSRLQTLCLSNHPALRWFPGFWFAGWYEQLRPVVSQARAPRAPDLAAAGRVLGSLAPLAIRSLSIASVIFLATFLPGYRAHARRVLETPEPNPKGPGRVGQPLRAAINRLLRDPVECAVFHFIGQTLPRSVKHRLFLATYGGFGAALLVIQLAGGGSSRRMPLMLSFILISGLRAAFNFPSDLRANWAFQVSETTTVAAYVRATRKWLMLCAIIPFFLLMAALDAARSPWPQVLFHFAFGVAISIVLMEALFVDFHKVPFTCAHFPGKTNLVLLGVLYCFGFTYYSSYMATLEDWLWAIPAAAVVFFPAIGAGLWALSRLRGHTAANDTGLEYDDDGDPAVRTLGLTEQ